MSFKDPSGSCGGGGGGGAIGGRDLGKLAPEEYIGKTKAMGHMQDAVNLLLEYRPEQPLVFLARFQMMCGDLGPVEVSAYYIQSCGSVTNTSFEDNMVLAYHALKKGNDPVDVSMFQQLLHVLCEDVPSAPNAKLVNHLAPTNVPVSYAKFKHAVEVCLLYGDVISEGEDLFQSIDTANAGEVKSSVLVSALELAGTKASTPNVELVLQLRDALEQVKCDDGNSSISLAQFLETVAFAAFPLAFSSN
ncbi:unnamed protein product [Aphanomyces euteiches]